MNVELGEIATTTLILAVLVVGWLLGRWHRGQVAHRILAARVAGLERDVERLAANLSQVEVEVARIDAAAVLWHSVPVGSDAGPEIA